MPLCPHSLGPGGPSCDVLARPSASREARESLGNAGSFFSGKCARRCPGRANRKSPHAAPASLGADEAILARRGRARRRVGPHGSPHAARAWRSNSLIHKALGATAIGLGRRWPSNGARHGPSRADLSGSGVTPPRSLSFARVHLHASVFLFDARASRSLIRASMRRHGPSRTPD